MRYSKRLQFGSKACILLESVFSLVVVASLETKGYGQGHQAKMRRGIYQHVNELWSSTTETQVMSHRRQHGQLTLDDRPKSSSSSSSTLRSRFLLPSATGRDQSKQFGKRVSRSRQARSDASHA